MLLFILLLMIDWSKRLVYTNLPGYHCSDSMFTTYKIPIGCYYIQEGGSYDPPSNSNNILFYLFGNRLGEEMI